MKKLNLLMLIITFAFSSTLATAQEQEEEEAEIPVGMEVIDGITVKTFAPKDAMRRQEGNLTVVESTEAYATRRILEMEERLGAIEEKQQRLEEQFGQLIESLTKAKEMQ